MGAKKYWILGVITPVIIASDQFTKAVVVERFRLAESLPVVDGFFNLTYIRNTGAAFGFLAGADPAFRVPFFLIVPVLALLAIGSIFRKISPDDRIMSVALSLVIGGAIGNLIDRVQIGYVIDFLLFHWKSEYYFPAFNVADSAICVGVGMMILDMLLKGKESEAQSHVSGPA
ncbi:MAG: signal peptidase II [Bdellovibrionota bacterium]